jgi:hypothetical protein
MSKKVDGSVLDWLLEKEDPGVRYLALRDLAGADTLEIETARKLAHSTGPIALVLENMKEGGYWEEKGPGYNPKYKSTVWSIILLSQLGASINNDERVSTACRYILDKGLNAAGQFSMNGLPSGTIDCLQGNLCAAVLDLGYSDPKLDKAFEWMAKTVTGEGIAPMKEKDAPVRYYAGKCGPNFACGGNNKQSCAWGAAKVMLAFSKLPSGSRTPVIERAVKAGIDFLFSTDPAKADYPSGYTGKPSGNWWKFGFPVFYVTDLLQIVESLAGLGCGKDPRLASALKLIGDKRDSSGRWPLEYNYDGRTWGTYGEMKKPNKWVTLRAMRALKAAFR